jgi:hypothetical protein
MITTVWYATKMIATMILFHGHLIMKKGTCHQGGDLSGQRPTG